MVIERSTTDQHEVILINSRKQSTKRLPRRRSMLRSNDTMNSAVTRENEDASEAGGHSDVSQQHASFYEQKDFVSERPLSSVTLAASRASRRGPRMIEVEDTERPETSAVDEGESERITLSRRPPVGQKRSKSKSIGRRAPETAAPVTLNINRDFSMYGARVTTGETVR